MGIRGTALNKLSAEWGLSSDATMGVPFLIEVATSAGTSTYNVWQSSCPRDCRIVYAWGVMTGAGGAGDTVVVQNSTTAITDTADLSVFADKEVFDLSEIDDAYSDIAEGGSMRVVTASDALCKVYILGVWRA